jgi:hypothetical protein
MRPFAIYFPQFYPTPTNDLAWGHSFTDWVLVANANLRDRWSRRAPQRGFYDGSSAEIHRKQISEMKQFGLGGMAVYHYWFYTHQELAAFESTLLAQSQGFPWFLIWASEGWSKRWLGNPSPILRLSDAPTMADIAKHCDYLASCFSSPDYFRVDHRPLFVFYNLGHFLDPSAVVHQYRLAMKQRGHDVCWGHFVKNPFDTQYSRLVDITYLFEPRLFFSLQSSFRGNTAKRIHNWLKSTLGDAMLTGLTVLKDKVTKRGITYSAELFLSYTKSKKRVALIQNITGTVQDVFSPGWNNTPRYSERFTSMTDIDPQEFAELVAQSSNRCKSYPPLINAWNEWSEGAAIEPCAYYGTRYLDAISHMK